MGFNKTVLAGIIAGMGGARYTLPTPILIESFDSASGWAVTNGATVTVDNTNHAQGSGMMVLSPNPTTGANGSATKTGYLNYDAAGMNVIAFFEDVGFDPELAQNGGSIRFGQPTGTPVVNYPSTATAGLYPDYGGKTGDYILGKTWHVIHTDDLAPSELQNGVPLGIRVQPASVSPASSPIKMDSLIANAKGRPTIILTFDDGRLGPYNEMSYMISRGIKGTIYLPWELVGQASRLTLSQCLEMKASGFDFQLDGTGDDKVISNRFFTVAEAVAHLADGKANLAANGLNTDARHFCYPNGVHRIPGARITVSSVTRSSGSAIVTMTSTTGIIAGMKAVGTGIPAGTTVVSNDSATQVTLSKNVTITNTLAMTFTDTSGEFHTGKLQAALRIAGWKTGRTTVGGPIYSRYGIGDFGLIMSGNTTTNGTSGPSGTMKGYIDRAKKYGSTMVVYIHDIFLGATFINADTTVFRAWMDELKAERDAGNIDILTVSEWYARDCANPASPPAAKFSIPRG